MAGGSAAYRVGGLYFQSLAPESGRRSARAETKLTCLFKPSRNLLEKDKGLEKVMQLILDKINAPVEASRVSRALLLSMLNESLTACSSTILNGRAGTGKTMLAADFARRCKRRVAWYKVDAADHELPIFFQYLIESIRRERPDFGERALAPLIETATVEDMPLLAESFIYELLEYSNDPLLIVLDDLHLVYDAEWFVPFFSRLLPLLPADAHVLITSRSLPPAPLWRMRSKQTLCVIEEGSLAFTLPEAKELFASYGLSRTEASAALKQVRGRAAALDALACLQGEAAGSLSEGQPAPVRRRRKTGVQQIHGYPILKCC